MFDPASISPVPDRHLDPSKVPVSDELKGLVEDAMGLLKSAEVRRRQRRPGSKRIHQQAVTSVICDLVHRELRHPGGALMVPMAKSALAPKNRPAPFMTEAFAKTVRELSDPTLGIAELRTGHRSLEVAFRSTLRAGTWLRSEIDRLGLGFHDIGRDTELQGDPLILKSIKEAGKSRVLPLPPTQEIEGLRVEMRAINAWIAQASIEWTGVEEHVDPGDRYLRRIFNNGSTALGGRMFHGFWQTLGKASRLEHLLINGREVASLDFSNMGVRLAYAAVGAPVPEGDLYLLPGIAGSREGVKCVLNALLCSDQLPTRYPQKTRAYFHRRLKFNELFDAICRRHQPLIPMFGTAQSLRQQNVESSIIVRALLVLKDMGIVALPVHDCLIAARENVGICKEVLEASFFHVTGVEGRVEVEERKEEGQESSRYIKVGGTPQSSIGKLAVPLKKGA